MTPKKCLHLPKKLAVKVACFPPTAPPPPPGALVPQSFHCAGAATFLSKKPLPFFPFLEQLKYIL
jgi:hypothetical protein